MLNKRVVVIFLDGVGLGEVDPEVNPFMHARLPALTGLLGVESLTREAAGAGGDKALLLGLDARLNVPGLPQSATGQTTILTGINAPAVLGEHYGPYPNTRLRQMLAQEAIFKTLLEAGQPVAYANAYPDRFLERVKRGKGRLSANTNGALMAGLKLRSHRDLQQGRAVAALLSNEHWPEADVHLPAVDAHQAGLQLAALAQDHVLTFFEFWYSDLLGHKMERQRSVWLLAQLDAFLSGTLAGLDPERSLLLVVSDHGNFEDWTTKKHTLNPALTIIAGAAAQSLAPHLTTLADIKPLILAYLRE